MPEILLDKMLVAARAGATEIMRVYAGDFAATLKSDGSPVTLADSLAEAAIERLLAPLGFGFLAEEGAAAGQVGNLGARFFCVDPLDGTREFVKRNGEFTVNIALIEDGRPTYGVILVPVTGVAFVGGPAGAYELGPDGTRVPLRTVAAPLVAKVVASRSHGHAALGRFCESLAIVEDISVGSSLKFCLLAGGKAQIYPRFTPTSQWDTAAGEAILVAAGGAVMALDGAPLAYGPSPDYLNPFFVAAASPDLARRGAEEMRRALR